MRKKGAALRHAQDEALRAVQESTMAPDQSPEHVGAGLGIAGRLPAPLPTFTPVPRRYRHDGWTPERQKAFIEALADTGCVTRAAGMVNMAQANAYALRRAPGAEAFRRAWDAALDFGLKRLKDIAFERAIEGQLVPVFVAGKLMGFRRKRNDALLMFCLRHYGQDAEGRRTTINYFSTRASAGAVAAPSEGAPPPSRIESGTVPLPQKSGGGLVGAEASTMTVRTVISGAPGGGDGAARDDAAAGVLNGFAGVALDAEAEAAIAAALEACAARARAAEAAYDAGGETAADAGEADPDESFVPSALLYRGELESPVRIEAFEPFTPGEDEWTRAGAEKPAALVAWEDEQAKGEAG